MDIAKEISKGLSERIIIAKVCKPAILGRMVPFTHSQNYQVDNNVWDLERPLEKSCSLELLDFEHPEGEHARVDLTTRV